MATVIRLARFGKRHNPIYRAVVIDSRKARDDSFTPGRNRPPVHS